MQNVVYDAIIVGAGAVGATLALGLHQSKKKVLLIEKHLPNFSEEGPIDSGTLALSFRTTEFLKKFEVLTEIEVTPILGVSVTVAGQPGQSKIKHADYHTDSLGAVVSAKALLASLHQLLRNKNIPLYYGATLCMQRSSLSQSNWQVYIETESGPIQVKTKLVICTDGKHSNIAKQNGIIWTDSKTQHTALVTNLKLKEPHQKWALERFFEGGTFALLPWDRQYFTNVWSLSQNDAEALFNLSEKEFVSECVKHSGWLQKQITAIGKRRLKPLQMSLASSQVGARLLLMGNAAHFLHPIAAQGFNLAVLDIILLLKLIETKSSDLGEMRLLQTFANHSQKHQTSTIQMTGFLSSIVAENKIPAFFQSKGVALFDALPFMRHRFARKGMGLV